MVKNILSIDVEELFHTEYSKEYPINHSYRTIDNLPLILDILKENDVSATFFVVGKILEKFPELKKMILSDGHEISFHGWDHKPLWELKSHEFRMDLNKFLKIHPQCIGYRAPSFSLDQSTKWALSELNQIGFKYDSSIFPVKTPLYGLQKAPLDPYRPSINDVLVTCDEGVWEFPLTIYPFLGLRIPASGGFYFRFMPYIIEKSIIERNKHKFPAIFYIHNWELDPKIPKINMSIYHSLVTYYNIKKTPILLRKLLKKFEFVSFKDYLSTSFNNDLC